MSRALVVIPCYNESAAIAGVVAEVRAVAATLPYALDVLVVDDCSTDDSLARIRALGCAYLALPVNLGIGGAMHSGFRYALAHNYDAAVQLDGDGQHPAEHLPDVLTPVLADEADVVIGSRFLERSGFQSTLARRLGIRYFRWLNQLLTGQAILDSTSGFRALGRKALALVNTYYPDEYPEPEAIVLFGRYGLRMQEVPVEMRARQGGRSSIGRTTALYYMAKVTLGCVFLWLRLRRLSC